MILTPFELPTRGLDSRSEPLSINPLGFQDMIDYSEEYESARTPLNKFLVDYKWIKKVIDNWRSINICDLDAVILKWKATSTSEGEEFSTVKRCPNCGHEQTLSLIMEQLVGFIPIEYNLNGEVILRGNTYQFKCPSLEEFDVVINKVTKSGRVKNIDLIKLISLFPQFNHNPSLIEDLVVNAKLSDIQVLKTLISIYFKNEVNLKVKCTKCGEEGWSMRVSSLIDSPFLSLVLSSNSISDKITIEQVRRD